MAERTDVAGGSVRLLEQGTAQLRRRENRGEITDLVANIVKGIEIPGCRYKNHLLAVATQGQHIVVNSPLNTNLVQIGSVDLHAFVRDQIFSPEGTCQVAAQGMLVICFGA